MENLTKWLMVVLIAAGGWARAEEASNTKPNIILIVADDLSRKLCTFLPGGEGKSLMPTIDRLAREGAILDNMHSPSPVCTPSRYSILTGNFPSRSRSHAFLRDVQKNDQAVVQFNTHIVPGEQTLGSLMKEAGYVTGFIGKNHTIEVDGRKNLPYKTALDKPGVQETLDKNAELHRHAVMAAGFDVADRLYYGNVDADGIEPLAYHNQEWITEGALNFIDQNKGKPFFLYMATTLPHGPFEPEHSWRSEKSITPEGILDAIPGVQAPRETIDTRLEEAGISGWNVGSVLWLDDAIAAIMQKLEEAGLDENTIVFFLSDHGTEAKGGAYLGGTHTAAIVWKKGGFSAGNHVPAGLQLIDIAPTVLDLAGGLRHDLKFDGGSFVPILRGESVTARDTMYFEMGYSRAIMKDGWKYIALRYPEYAENMSIEERQRILDDHIEKMEARGRPVPNRDPAAPFSHLFLIPGGHDVDLVAIKNHPHFFDRDQLYNVETDRGEQTNLASQDAFRSRLDDMEDLLGRYVRQLPGRFGEFSEGGVK